jgi:hypothetical protein
MRIFVHDHRTRDGFVILPSKKQALAVYESLKGDGKEPIVERRSGGVFVVTWKDHARGPKHRWHNLGTSLRIPK